MFASEMHSTETLKETHKMPGYQPGGLVSAFFLFTPFRFLLLLSSCSSSETTSSIRLTANMGRWENPTVSTHLFETACSYLLLC